MHTRMSIHMLTAMSHEHGRPLEHATYMYIWNQMPMALSSDTAPGALCTARCTPQIDTLRHAAVGVLYLRRALKLGKPPRATHIPAPGPTSSSLTLTLSPCGICRLASPPWEYPDSSFCLAWIYLRYVLYICSHPCYVCILLIWNHAISMIVLPAIIVCVSM